jgi:hypothetical protein
MVSGDFHYIAEDVKSILDGDRDFDRGYSESYKSRGDDTVDWYDEHIKNLRRNGTNVDDGPVYIE